MRLYQENNTRWGGELSDTNNFVTALCHSAPGVSCRPPTRKSSIREVKFQGYELASEWVGGWGWGGGGGCNLQWSVCHQVLV